MEHNIRVKRKGLNRNSPDGALGNQESVSVVGIAGSLRKRSYNRALLRASKELAPDGMHIHIFDLTPIPLFNQDIEDVGDPAPVSSLKDSIRAADALLFATPEYQYGIPGVLKNAIDWASRPTGESSLRHKPVAVMGATPGFVGTARAQLQLRQVLGYNETRMLFRPEVLVANANEKFDDELRLTDEATRDFVRRLVEKLYRWTLFLRAGQSDQPAERRGQLLGKRRVSSS